MLSPDQSCVTFPDPAGSYCHPASVIRFVAVLNPPQAAILAVGAIEEKPVVRDGEARR